MGIEKMCMYREMKVALAFLYPLSFPKIHACVYTVVYGEWKEWLQILAQGGQTTDVLDGRESEERTEK